MAKTLFKVLFGFLNLLASTIFGPIFQLLDALLLGLNFDSFVNNFLSVLDTYVVPFTVWFLEQIPPMTLSVIILEVTFTVSFFALSFSINIILKILKLIKKLPVA